MEEPQVAQLLDELQAKNTKVKFLKRQLNQFKRDRMNGRPVYQWHWQDLCQFIIAISTAEQYKPR